MEEKMKTNGKYSIYRVGVAGILKRFFSSIIDTAILSVIATIFIFFTIQPQLIETLKNKTAKNDIELQVSSSGEVSSQDERVEVKGNSVKIKVDENKNDNEDFIKTFANVKSAMMGSSKIQLFMVFFDCIYYMLFLLSSKQATIGQQLFGLMTIRKDGERLNFNDALNRTCLYYILKLTAFTIFFSKRQETLYDYLSKTQVIEIQ